MLEPGHSIALLVGECRPFASCWLRQHLERDLCGGPGAAADQGVRQGAADEAEEGAEGAETVAIPRGRMC